MTRPRADDPASGRIRRPSLHDMSKKVRAHVARPALTTHARIDFAMADGETGDRIYEKILLLIQKSRNENAALRTEAAALRTEVAALRTERKALRTERKALRTEIVSLRRSNLVPLRTARQQHLHSLLMDAARLRRSPRLSRGLSRKARPSRPSRTTRQLVHRSAVRLTKSERRS